MSNYHWEDNHKTVVATAPAAAVSASTITGATIDRQAQGQEYFDGKASVITGAAMGSPTGISIDLKIQDSDDGTTFADVTDPYLVEAASKNLAAASSAQGLAFRAANLRRYIRPVATLSFTGGSSPTIFLMMLVGLMKPRYTP